MKAKPNLFALFPLLGLLIISSCRKEERDSPDNDTTTALEYSLSDAAYNDVAGIADEALDGALESYRIGGGANDKVLTTCATITIDTLASPKNLLIDFGSSDCLCRDGNYRRGKILVSWTGPYRDSGSVRTINFDNYYVNYNLVQGSKVITANGRNQAGNLTFSVTVNGSITWDPQYLAGGGTSTYSSTRTREWIAGEGTISWLDDVYLISGAANGTTRNGGSYTMQTTEPLRKEIGFRHFTDGVIAFTPQGKYTRIIDYGYVNSGRDRLAKVTINGSEFTITLP